MRLEVSFRVLNKNLDVDFSAKDKKLNAEFQCFQRITEQGDVDYYDGSYTVTPKVEEQSLPTIFHHIDASNFGDALASDVAKGKTFTSVAGVKVVGTREESGGSGGDTTLNAEVQTIANATSPSATFSGTGGTYKVYGYGKGTTSGYTTPQYAFCGDKYYTMASWGNPTPKSMTISVDENGNITGLPALASGNLTIVRTP